MAKVRLVIDIDAKEGPDQVTAAATTCMDMCKSLTVSDYALMIRRVGRVDDHVMIEADGIRRK